jgi:hypothetical protein
MIRERILRRFRHDALSDRIHPDIPRDRVSVLGPTENMVVETSLPKAAREFVAKCVAYRLFPLRDEFYEVRRGALCLHQQVHVIRHHTVRVHEKSHAHGDTSERIDGSFRAICLQENRAAIFAADAYEIDF